MRLMFQNFSHTVGQATLAFFLTMTLPVVGAMAADAIAPAPSATAAGQSSSSNAVQISKEARDAKDLREAQKELKDQQTATNAAIAALQTAKQAAPDLEGECRRVGERVISLLYRDDVDQSRKFLEFYRLFNCRESHLAPSFRCLARRAEAETLRYQAVLTAVNGDAAKVKKEDQQRELAGLVNECWSAP